MKSLRETVRDTLKKYGDEAPARFGVNPKTLKRYIKTGHYPLSLIQKIEADAMVNGDPRMIVGDMMAAVPDEMPPAPEPAPPPPPPLEPEGVMTIFEHGITKRLAAAEKYLQGTVDFYLRQFDTRLKQLEQTYQMLRVEQMRQAGVGGSLARPAQGAPIVQTYTTNPVGGNSLDTGIAPTKEMVDAQAGMTYIGGVPVPNAQIAGPAVPIPNQPSFGFGWNQPRPPR